MHGIGQSGNGPRTVSLQYATGVLMDIVFALGSTFVGCVAVLVAVTFWRVLKAGPKKVSYLRRKDYGFVPWATGSLSKTAGGSTLHELEGLEVRASGGRLSYVRQTRAPASEL